MKKNIEVTKEDIYSGTRTDCQRCPIALAVNRALGIKTSIIGRECMYLNKDSTEIHLPLVARNFISSFDYGILLAPFSFEIELPD